MGEYNLAYTGSQVNAALAESARLISEGGRECLGIRGLCYGNQ